MTGFQFPFPVQYCLCEPVAPPLCVCLGDVLDKDWFIARGVKCEGTNCPAPDIDFSGVDTDDPELIGTRQTYTVSCGEGCPEVEGCIALRDQQCDPVAKTYPAATLQVQKDGGRKKYDIGTMTAKVDNDGYLVVDFKATSTAGCGQWKMMKTALNVSISEGTTCNPQEFNYKTSHFTGVTGYTYRVPLTDIKGYECSDNPTIYLNGRAEVSSKNCGCHAWALGNCGKECEWSGGEVCIDIECNCNCPSSYCPPCIDS